MIAVLAVAVGLWYARTAILLAFAGILLAIVVYGASKALAELTKLPRLLMLAVVVLVDGAVLRAGVLRPQGPTLTQQIAQLARSHRRRRHELTKELASFADQTAILQNIDLVDVARQIPEPVGHRHRRDLGRDLDRRHRSAPGSIVLFFGIYFAADPDTYVDIVARLSPPERRAAILEVMYETGNRLRRWLIGQGISMAMIGSLTYIGLLILGVPIAFVLALFAGLAGFLPYLGPIIGAIPMVLVAGGESLHLALLGGRALRDHPVPRKLPAHAADPGACGVDAAGGRHPEPARVRRRVRASRPGARHTAGRRCDRAAPLHLRDGQATTAAKTKLSNK